MAKAKRKQWRNEDMISDMISAMTAVQDHVENVYSASMNLTVPRCTLRERCTHHGSNPGRKTVLTKKEEAALVSYMLHMERGSHKH